MRLQREGSTLAARAFGVIAGLASSAITARALGPEQRGEYFYVVSIAMMLSNFGHLGTSSSNSFFAAKDPSSAGKLAAWSGLLAGLMGLAVALIFIAVTRLGPFTKYAAHHATFLLILTPAVLGTSMMSPLLAGLHRFGAFNLLQVAQQGLLLVGFALIALAQPTPAAFLMASGLVGLAAAATQAFLASRGRAVQGVDRITIREWFRYGIRAYPILLLGGLLSRVAIVFVRAKSSPADLGQFSVAMQMWDALALIPTSLAIVLFPTIVRSRALTWPHCSTEAKRMLLVALPIAILTAALLRPAISIVFGDAFLPAYIVSLWLLPGFVGYSALVVFSQYLAAIGFPRAVLMNWIVAIVVGVGASWLLAPRYGAVGGALATSIAYVLLVLMMCSTARRELPAGRVEL